MTRRRILVTGANGLVGSCVVEALFVAGSYDIVPTSRRLHGGGRVARFGLRLRPSDLSGHADVDALVQGADAVVHCAYGGDTDQEAATANLLAAAAKAGVRCFIHLSTTDIYVARTGVLDEDAPIRLQGQAYGDIKGRIDALVRESAAHFESVVVLRPAIIYGPMSDNWTIRPMRRLLAGWRPRKEELQGIGNFVHVADVCHVIAQILARPPSGLRVYNVAGPEVVTWAEYFERFARALGVTVPAEDVPTNEKVQLGIVRTMLRILPTQFRRKMVGLITQHPAGMWMVSRWKRLHLVEASAAEREFQARTVRYSNARLLADGFRLRVSLEEGLQQSAAWARQVGLIS